MTKTPPYAGAQAVERALSLVGMTHFRPPSPAAGRSIQGRCQQFSNEVFAPDGRMAVGDQDGDRDADAVDGWKSAQARTAIRYDQAADVPAATIVYWSGGGSGYGHAAVSIGGGRVVSTDAPELGKVGVVPIDWFRTNWTRHQLLGYITVDAHGYDLGAYMISGPGAAGGAGSGAPTTNQPQGEDDMTAEDRQRITRLEAALKARTTVDGVAIGDKAIIDRIKKLEAALGARTTVDGVAVGDTSIVRRIEALESRLK